MLSKKSIALFQGFHKFEPRKIAAFPGKGGLHIPEAAMYVGKGKRVLYSSDKFNPETGEDEGLQYYYHDHKPGVNYCRFDTLEGKPRKIPKWIRDSEELVFLGKCEGFVYEGPDGETVAGEATAPLPDLFAVPPLGKALLVVQDLRKVVCVMWGGKLVVEPRGIVG